MKTFDELREATREKKKTYKFTIPTKEAIRVIDTMPEISGLYKKKHPFHQAMKMAYKLNFINVTTTVNSETYYSYKGPELDKKAIEDIKKLFKIKMKLKVAPEVTVK